ncbi:uncharacterized protein TrAtP1_012530 [Trichoderma atroviride]|uniref:uncharacterized protein n=1 Tax=Hypocrea atroviridis TaxID=63577 RepID=UPI003328A9F1|nr:hypothetical protein TrAtP1_012530 [Trichoderma atroviride]
MFQHDAYKHAQGMLASIIWIDMDPRRRATRCEPMLVYPIPLYRDTYTAPCIAIHKHCKGQLRVASSCRQAPKRRWIIQAEPPCTYYCTVRAKVLGVSFYMPCTQSDWMETVRRLSPAAHLRVHRVEPGGGRSGVDAPTMSNICRSRITAPPLTQPPVGEQ